MEERRERAAITVQRYLRGYRVERRKEEIYRRGVQRRIEVMSLYFERIRLKLMGNA